MPEAKSDKSGNSVLRPGPNTGIYVLCANDFELLRGGFADRVVTG